MSKKKTDKKNTNIRALKLLYSFSPSYFPLMIARSFFSKLSPYFNVYLSAEIVNEIVSDRNTYHLGMLVLITVIGNFVIALAAGILGRAFGHSETKLNQNEAAYYNRKTLSLEYHNLEDPDIRQLRRKIVESARINSHGRQLLMLSVSRMTNVLMSIGLSTILCVEMITLIIASEFSWIPIFYIALIGILIALSVWYNFKSNEKKSQLSRDISQTMIEENRIDDAVDCYNMGKDVRLYRQDILIMKIKQYAFELHKKAFRTRAKKSFVIGIPVHMIAAPLQIGTYIFICIYAIRGVFGIGSIIKYVGFSTDMIGGIISLFHICSDIKNNTQFVEDYLAYFDIPETMHQGTRSVEKQLFHNGGSKYEVEFRNVSFRYPSSEAFALKNISIKFRIGEKLAIVGMNGSGKTTFIKLLCRLYDPTEGQILLNGIDIREYDYDEYMSIFSVVFQDYKLFSFSLANNVAASEEYDSERVERCLREAGFGERMSQMPEGIQTCLYKDFDKNGVEISGGEAQKIAIARALYKDAPFIILDEPTAALDPIAEYEIYSKFNEIVDNRTAIYISHRLSSCRFCDRIAVFDNGRIVQIGSHDSLLTEEKGRYYELWYAQAQYYA